MKFTFATVAAILAATSSAAVPKKSDQLNLNHHSKGINGTDVWVTTTVTAYKTFCPESTTFTEGKHTYTATASEWVTITACPDKCTVSYKSAGTPYVVPLKVKPAGTAPVCSATGTGCPYATSNGTYVAPAAPTSAPGTPATVGSNSGNSGSPANNGANNGPAQFEGASNTVAAPAALAALVGAVAYLL